MDELADLVDPPCLVRLQIPDEVPAITLSSHIRHQLCMALKECMNNIIKHAQAHEVRVRIELNNRILSMTISDDGVGFEVSSLYDTTGAHDGHINFRKRMADIHGVCGIQSTPGHGTRIRFQVSI